MTLEDPEEHGHNGDSNPRKKETKTHDGDIPHKPKENDRTNNDNQPEQEGQKTKAPI